MGCEGEWHQRVSPWTGTPQLQHHAFRFEPEPENIGSSLSAVFEGQVGYRSKVHGDLLQYPAQCLAGPEPEVRVGRAPVVQLEVYFGEGLRAAFRVHAVFFGVGRD